MQDDAVKKVIGIIRNARLTDLVYTTYDHQMMENCKNRIIVLIEENFYGNDTLSNKPSNTTE